MKLLKITFLSVSLFFLFSCASTPAPAPLGTAYEETEALFVTMHLAEQYDLIIEQTLDTQLKANPALVPYRNAMLEFFTKFMSFESLKDDLIKIYAEEFTAQELREMNEFFSTTTGQKYALLSSTLTQKGSELGLKKVQENMHELQAIFQDAQ